MTLFESLFATSSVTVLCVFLAIAALIDSKTHKIPNWLILAGAGIGVLLVLLGEVGLKSAILGFSAGFMVFFLLYMLGFVGAGDVKLMGVSGLILGFSDIIIFLILACLISSVLSLVYLIVVGKGGLLLRDLSRVLRPIAGRLGRSKNQTLNAEKHEEAMVRMPFAPGAFVAALYFSYNYIPSMQVFSG